MKAAVWHKKRDIRIEDIPELSPLPGQVKVKIKACGICGSDLHEFREGPFIIPSRRHPLTNRQGGPVILGHEFAGEVVGIGEGITRFTPGDRVVVNPLIYCGECHYCKLGQYIMCTKLGTVGFATDGAFAEYGIFHEYSLFHLPESVTDEMGTFVEPLAVAVHAVVRSRMRIGASVAVIGAGPIGLLVMQASLAAGAGRVFVIEPLKTRRKIALETGAAAVIDPAETDVGKTIGKWTEGLRADLAFDCVGNQSSFDSALRVTGRRSVICVVGLALQPIEAPFFRLWGHEKEIVFSSGYQDEFPAAISYLADKRVRVEKLISDSIKLEEIVEKGIYPLLEQGEHHLKILVYP